jgi:hypothetical protein
MLMKIIRIAVIVFMGILLMAGASCGGGENAEPTATPIVTATPTPLPTVVMSCDQARDAIQIALDAYNAMHGDWPTIDGQPGDIEWSKLAPDFIDGIPSNDNKCEWWVNSNPEGDVCLQNVC